MCVYVVIQLNQTIWTYEIPENNWWTALFRVFEVQWRFPIDKEACTAYNMFQGRLDMPLEEFFEAPSERNLRRHDFQLRHRRFHRARRGAAFSVRLAPKWNALPLEVVTATTLLDDRWVYLFLDVLWKPTAKNVFQRATSRWQAAVMTSQPTER